MKSMLIVTSRNVATAGGEFSLIKNRADALEKNWGVHSDIVSLCNTALNVPEGSEAFGAGTYIRCNFSNPIALINGYRRLIKTVENKLHQTHYDAVLLSGVGLPRYVTRVRAAAGFSTLICADVHGYYGDGRLLAKDESLFMGAFHTLASMVEEYEQKHFLKQFDRIFTVSSAYRTFLCDHAGCQPSQFYIVPCGTGSIPVFSTDDILAYRTTYRDKYGVKPNEKLLVYSGGASSWQCLPQTIALYNEISRRLPCRLLLLTGDPIGVKSVTGGRPDILIDSYKPTDLPKVFCAADFFLMLREDVPTNHYAFPNKYLEYAASHKPIISTPYIYDVAKQIKSNGIGIIFDGNVNRLIQEMEDHSCKADEYDHVVRMNSFASTLVPFARDLGVIG